MIQQSLLLWMKRVGGIYRWEEKESCHLCGSREFIPYARRRYGFIVITLKSCRNCGFVIQNPSLTKESLDDFYHNEYRLRLRNRLDGRHCQKLFERGIRRGVYICKFLEENKIKVEDPTIIFEAGCGYGGILEHFKRLGCRVAGCDLNGGAVAYGIKKGLDLRTGSAETLKELALKADIVILSHVLEHVIRPGAFLRDVKDALSRGGTLYIETPGIKNEKMNIKRFAQIGHLNYFSLDSLRLMAEAADFEFINGNEIVQAVFRKKEE